MIEQLVDDEALEKDETHELIPKHPFRLIISGESGCGKTNLVVNLLLKYLEFDSLFVCAKDLVEKTYEQLQEYFELLNKIDISVGAEFYNNLDDMKTVDELSHDNRNVVVFDDCITQKKQDLIQDMFIRGRKKNASIIYITQSYYKVPKIIRDNSNYYIFFKLQHRDLKRILKEIDGYELPNVNLEAHDFLMLDRKNPKLKIRKNFIPILNDLQKKRATTSQ